MFTASSLPGSAAPVTSGAVSTATFLGVLVWGWGAFVGLSCFLVTTWVFCMVGEATTELQCWLSPLLLCRHSLPAAITGCSGFLFWLCRGWYTPEQVSCTPDPIGFRFTIPADTSFLCQ